MAPGEDIPHSVTPELNIDEDSVILIVKINQKNRLAGSIFSEVTESQYTETPDIDDVKLFKSLFNLFPLNPIIADGSLIDFL